MKEIELQQLMIDVARKRGGEGHKMSNRFLVGVSDLMIKLPNTPACLIEVKQATYSPRHFKQENHLFRLDVTAPQKAFLRDFHKAGMNCGVGSFIQTNKGIRDLYLNIYDLPRLEKRGFNALIKDHMPLGDHTTREDRIYNLLLAFSQPR